MQTGNVILNQVRDEIQDKPLLVDLKIADIGFLADGKFQGTNSKIISGLALSGATHVTAHGFPGPVSVAEAVESAKQFDLNVLLLPLMSHAGASLFFSRPVLQSDVMYSSIKAGLEIRIPEDFACTDVTEGILLLGEALGVDGYIGPATRPVDLERYRSITDKPIWCPGFGRQDRQGRNLEVQFREWAAIVGRKSAAIVGSAIFGAPDPFRAASEIAELRDRVIG
jgi:orotidine-5'-phosphate decarboxylase